MGCDIHTHAERRTMNGYEHIKEVVPFDWREYGLYGFLAGVRNYSDVTPLAAGRGMPIDASVETVADHEAWAGDAHSASWVDVLELSRFDYDQPMEDRRITVQTGPNSWNGGATADPGGGKRTTYREFLGDAFFDDLRALETAGADRIVFWFDC